MYTLGTPTGILTLETLEQKAETLKNVQILENRCAYQKDIIDTLCLLDLAYNRDKRNCRNNHNIPHLKASLVIKLHILTKRKNLLDFGGTQLFCKHAIKIMLSNGHLATYQFITTRAFRKMAGKARKPKNLRIIEECFLQLARTEIHPDLLEQIKKALAQAKKRLSIIY